MQLQRYGAMFGPSPAQLARYPSQSLLDETPPDAQVLNPDQWAALRANPVRGAGDIKAINRTIAFQDRHRINSYLNRIQDMRDTLDDPGARIQKVIDEIHYLSYTASNLYLQKRQQYIDAGFEEIKANELAEQYIRDHVNNELDVLAHKYPYSFDSGQAINEMIYKSDKLMRNNRFFLSGKKNKKANS